MTVTEKKKKNTCENIPRWLFVVSMCHVITGDHDGICGPGVGRIQGMQLCGRSSVPLTVRSFRLGSATYSESPQKIRSLNYDPKYRSI